MYKQQYIINLLGQHKFYLDDLRDKISIRGQPAVILNYDHNSKRLNYSGGMPLLTPSSRVYIIAHTQNYNDEQLFSDDAKNSISYVELAKLIKEKFAFSSRSAFSHSYPKIFLMSCTSGMSLNTGYPFDGFAGNFHRQLAKNEYGQPLYSMVVASTTIVCMYPDLKHSGRKLYGLMGTVRDASSHRKIQSYRYSNQLDGHKLIFSWNSSNGQQIVFSKGMKNSLCKEYMEYDGLGDILARYKNILYQWKDQARQCHLKIVDKYIQLISLRDPEPFVVLCHALNTFRAPGGPKPLNVGSTFGVCHSALKNNYPEIYFEMSILIRCMIARRDLINYYGCYAEIRCSM